jgi:membrane protease YdiL (CAAX protease family)
MVEREAGTAGGAAGAPPPAGGSPADRPGEEKPVVPGLFLRVFLFLLVSLGAQLLVLVVFVFGMVLRRPDLHLDPEGIQALTERMAIPLTFLVAPVQVLVVIAFRKGVDRRSLTSLGFTKRGRAAADFGRGALLALVLLAVEVPAVLWFSGGSLTLRSDADLRVLGTFLYLLLGFLLVGINEEIVFRGYLFRNLLEGRGIRTAVFVSAALFALLHGLNPNFSWVAFGNILLIGVLLCVTVVRTGALWAAFGFHFAWNYLLGCFFSLPVSGIRVESLFTADLPDRAALWTGGSFGPEGGLINTVTTAVALLVLLPGALRTGKGVGPESPGRTPSSAMDPAAGGGTPLRG